MRRIISIITLVLCCIGLCFTGQAQEILEQTEEALEQEAEEVLNNAVGPQKIEIGGVEINKKGNTFILPANFVNYKSVASLGEDIVYMYTDRIALVGDLNPDFAIAKSARRVDRENLVEIFSCLSR